MKPGAFHHRPKTSRPSSSGQPGKFAGAPRRPPAPLPPAPAGRFMSNLNWAASWLKTVGYVTVGYLAVSAGMGCGKSPRDLRMAPQDLLHSLMTGHAGRNPAPAAMSSPATAAAYDGYCRPEQGDMATVHGSRRAVAQAYGRYIPRDTSCVSPAIEFDDQLANAKGAPTAGRYDRRFKICLAPTRFCSRPRYPTCQRSPRMSGCIVIPMRISSLYGTVDWSSIRVCSARCGKGRPNILRAAHRSKNWSRPVLMTSITTK